MWLDSSMNINYKGSVSHICGIFRSSGKWDTCFYMACYVFTLHFWRTHIATIHRWSPTHNKDWRIQIKKWLTWRPLFWDTLLVGGKGIEAALRGTSFGIKLLMFHLLPLHNSIQDKSLRVSATHIHGESFLFS